jgi:hypothetical protein
MTKVSGNNLVKLKDSLNEYFTQYNTEIDTNHIAEILNEWTDDSDRLYTHDGLRKGVHKILICTGAGNTIVGGADMWVNEFLTHVWPTLPLRKTWKLLIDSKRPTNFNPSSLPKGLTYHFHGDNPEVTEEWLKTSQEIHVLHPHYHKRPHIWHHEDKFKSVFVHAYAKDIVNVLNKIPELNQLQTQTNVDEIFYNEYLSTFKKRVWIGNNYSSLLDDFPNYTWKIPNIYQFKHNITLSSHINNGKIGFASRAETRKCLHWLNGLQGFALTSQYDVKNLRDTTTYSLKDIDIYQWDPEIHHQFMLKNWGIFHGAYFQEPFGYSIFQAVDYGKLPILNWDWAPEVEYRYRAGNKMEFDKIIKTILKDSYEIRLENFMRLKSYMLQFGNVEKWVDDIRNILLR